MREAAESNYIETSAAIIQLNYVEVRELFRQTYNKFVGSKGQYIERPET